jgi:hypothetical protein
VQCCIQWSFVKFYAIKFSNERARLKQKTRNYFVPFNLREILFFRRTKAQREASLRRESANKRFGGKQEHLLLEGNNYFK